MRIYWQTMNNEPIIEIKNLSFTYKKQLVLEAVNFSVYREDFVAIIGPNGGGKTTLVKLILGLLKPKEGFIHVFGSFPEKVQWRSLQTLSGNCVLWPKVAQPAMLASGKTATTRSSRYCQLENGRCVSCRLPPKTHQG